MGPCPVEYTNQMLPRSRVESWGSLCLVAAAALPTFVVAYLGRVAAGWLETPRMLFGAVLLVILVILLGPWCWRRILYRRRLRPTNAAESRHGARITLVDLPEGLAAYGPWEDVMFEPEEFYAPCSLGPTRHHIAIASLIGLACAAVMVLFWHVGVLPAMSLRLRIEGLITIPLFTGCLCACLFRPVYLRISPGLLEVVSRTPSSGRVRAIRRLDLTQSRLTVDLWRLVARVSGSAGDSVFSLHLVWGHRKCAWFLVLAALSTHKPPTKSLK